MDVVKLLLVLSATCSSAQPDQSEPISNSDLSSRYTWGWITVEDQPDFNDDDHFREVIVTNACDQKEIYDLWIQGNKGYKEPWPVYNAANARLGNYAQSGQFFQYPDELVGGTYTQGTSVLSIWGCTRKVGCGWFTWWGMPLVLEKDMIHCCGLTSTTSGGCKFFPWNALWSSCIYTIHTTCTHTDVNTGTCTEGIGWLSCCTSSLSLNGELS